MSGIDGRTQREFENAVLSGRLSSDSQIVLGGLDEARTYAHIKIGTERTVLRSQQRGVILCASVVILCSRSRINQRTGGIIGRASFYRERDGSGTFTFYFVYIGIGHVLCAAHLIEDGNLFILGPGDGNGFAAFAYGFGIGRLGS